MNETQLTMHKVILQGEADIPTDYGNFTMRAYSNKVDDYTPTLVIYNPNTKFDKLVTVRIHSECITGDLFGSIDDFLVARDFLHDFLLYF